MWERKRRRSTLSSRILVLVSAACLLLFLGLAPSATAATTHAVKVGGVFVGPPLAQGGVVWFNGYDQATIVIRPGDTVQWTLVGGLHTVTSTQMSNTTAFTFDSDADFPVAAALGDMSPGRLLPPGSVYEVDTTSLAPATYVYFCKIHDGMHGNITVTTPPTIGQVANVVAGWGDTEYAVQAFAPENLTVSQGTIVRWTLLNPTEPHTITEDLTGGALWDSSPDLPPGAPPVMGAPGQNSTFSWKFDTEGTFTYFCKLHAYKIGNSWVGMTGTVIVEKSTSEAVGGLSPLTYAGLGIGIVALLIGLGAVGLSRRKGRGGMPPPNP
jgi:plastocyanin